MKPLLLILVVAMLALAGTGRAQTPPDQVSLQVPIPDVFYTPINYPDLNFRVIYHGPSGTVIGISSRAAGESQDGWVWEYDMGYNDSCVVRSPNLFVETWGAVSASSEMWNPLPDTTFNMVLSMWEQTSPPPIDDGDTIRVYIDLLPRIGNFWWYPCDSTLVEPAADSTEALPIPQARFSEVWLDLEVDTTVPVDPMTWGRLKSKYLDRAKPQR